MVDSSPRRVAVVSAGLSHPSSTRILADRLAHATLERLGERGMPAEVDTFELRDHAHEITDNLLTGFAPPKLETMVNAVVSADALIAVTPIFSTSYSGLFKSFIDVLDPDALAGKPVLIGANAGTVRHSLAIDYAIRPLFAYLHTQPVSTGVFAASADWGGADDGSSPLSERIARAAAEFADAIGARPVVSRIDPFDPAAYLGRGRSFDDLLGGLSRD
ncbi:CE1759 family FMN reductase [Microbacterium xanthum]|uniref:CE1759 family FMN reductase n=1 Tax=Microbacterium xanthum TaxID=3079794 RepID=UPI002AD55579|nr:CE1759 family FMN reductase [Microbacterium sp. KSW-48]MDZ8171292.1 NAD(P)H-dependent oxidoreductase [Microbacterium sp. KSW-48]